MTKHNGVKALVSGLGNHCRALSSLLKALYFYFIFLPDNKTLGVVLNS